MIVMRFLSGLTRQMAALGLIVVAGVPLFAQKPLTIPPVNPPPPLLVVGFLGGRVRADNMVHREASLGRDLQQRDGNSIQVLTFANHDGDLPLQAVLHLLDRDGNGKLSLAEKRQARVVIYGHSWGACETVHLAQQLNNLGIPVLLTVQVDSVRKQGENDELIPPNVQQAMNFYQTEGLLHGRSIIRAADPKRTTILGNRQVSYRDHAVDISQFPWFARSFMRQHIEIENDPAVWDEVESLIEARLDASAPLQ